MIRFQHIRDAAFRQKFWSMVDVRADPFACWAWLGAVNNRNYGVIRVPTYKGNITTHRASLMLCLGRDMAPNSFACHTCDNPPCVNPRHLYEGSESDNMRDRARRNSGSWARGKFAGRAKITESEVREMRLRRMAGERVAVLCAEFGLSENAVRALLARTTWRHVK